MENLDLDAWRIQRAKYQRTDEAMIDTLCDMLLSGQKREAELQAQVVALTAKLAEPIPAPAP